MDVEASRRAPAGWNDLVDSDPRATFFHRTEWASALCEAGVGSDELYLYVERAGELVAGIPAVVIQRGPFRLVASMPHGTNGGLVARGGAAGETAPALLEALADHVGGAGVAAAHLMDEAGRIPEPPRGFEKSTEQAHRISLEEGYEAVWAAFRPSARN